MDLPQKHLSVKRKVKQEERKLSKNNGKTCIICEEPAEYCMRGVPSNTYCRECALEYFKFLNYLEKM